jgi:NitT/TauT family transport system permease protein
VAGRPDVDAVKAQWSRSRAGVLGVAGLVLAAGVWELYKAAGPQAGLTIGQTIVLPRANDGVMPHVWQIITEFAKPVTAGAGSQSIGSAVIDATWFTLRLAGTGWIVGVIVGFALAMLMTRSRLAEAAALPWVVVSQTVPLIAIAPLLAGWGQYLHIGSWQWGLSQSVMVISAYLAFYPMSIGALKGLSSPDTYQLELMHVYGVGWWRTFLRLRLPAAVPYLLPALRLAATMAVVGAVVGETSVNLQGGIGNLIISFQQTAGLSDPARAWAPITGAMADGLIAAGVVALIGVLLRRYRRGESA